MDGIAVARRCADLTEEIFEIAKLPLRDQRGQQNQRSALQPTRAQETGLNSLERNVDASQPQHQWQSNLMSDSGPPTRTNLLLNSAAAISTVRNDDCSLDDLSADFFSTIVDTDFMDHFDANLSAMNFGGLPFEDMTFTGL